MPTDLRLQKAELLGQLGVLMQPVLALIDTPDRYDDDDRTAIIAQYSANWPALHKAFHDFCRAQNGYDYELQVGQLGQHLGGVIGTLTRSGGNTDHIPIYITRAQEVIMSIPTPRTSLILEAHSPFSTHTLLRDLCITEAQQRIIWVDPYMHENIFYRYLRVVLPNVAVILVTEGPRNGRRRDQERWKELLDMSRLFASEYPDRYRLIVRRDLHDRWVLFDDKRLYMLGGSAKDASDRSYFTLGRIDPTPENLTAIQTHVDTGEEYFGPKHAHA